VKGSFERNWMVRNDRGEQKDVTVKLLKKPLTAREERTWKIKNQKLYSARSMRDLRRRGRGRSFLGRWPPRDAEREGHKRRAFEIFKN